MFNFPHKGPLFFIVSFFVCVRTRWGRGVNNVPYITALQGERKKEDLPLLLGRESCKIFCNEVDGITDADERVHHLLHL